VATMDHAAIQGPKGLEGRRCDTAGLAAESIRPTGIRPEAFARSWRLWPDRSDDGGASTIGPDVSESAGLYSVEDALRWERMAWSERARASHEVKHIQWLSESRATVTGGGCAGREMMPGGFDAALSSGRSPIINWPPVSAPNYGADLLKHPY